MAQILERHHPDQPESLSCYAYPKHWFLGFLLTWKMSLAHLRQRLCWQGKMTTGLVNISKQMGQISCFSRLSMLCEVPSIGLKPTAKFIPATPILAHSTLQWASPQLSLSLNACLANLCSLFCLPAPAPLPWQCWPLSFLAFTPWPLPVLFPLGEFPSVHQACFSFSSLPVQILTSFWHHSLSWAYKAILRRSHDPNGIPAAIFVSVKGAGAKQQLSTGSGDT